jgi:hypothetical protein
LVVGLSQDRILRIAEKMVKGTASKTDLRDARSIGMDFDLAADFIHEWSNVGATKYKRGGRNKHSLYMSDFKKWADQDTAWKFRAILQGEVNNAVLRPTMAERPMALTNPYMRMLLLYKQFAITVTNRMMGRAIEQRQLQALSGVIAGLGLGVIINSLRQPDYLDKDIDEILFDALQTSGMLGIFMEGNDAVERITGEAVGLRPLLGLEGYNAGDSSPGQRLGALGPVLGQWSALGEAVYDAGRGEFSGKKTAAAMMDFMPTQNFWAWRSQMRQIERGLGSTLEAFE